MTQDTEDVVAALRLAEQSRQSFEDARHRMNDARPDPIHATRAERALYDERYQADNEAERAYRIAALELFTSGKISKAADLIQSLSDRIDELREALNDIAWDASFQSTSAKSFAYIIETARAALHQEGIAPK